MKKVSNNLVNKLTHKVINTAPYPLTDENTGCVGIAKSITDYLRIVGETQTLSITDPVIRTEGGVITVSGKADRKILNQDLCALTCIITPKDQGKNFTLTISMPTNWKFFNSFNSLAEDATFSQITLNSAYFILTSFDHNYAAPLQAFDLKMGLNFQAESLFPAFLDPLTYLFGPLSNLIFQGPITDSSDIKEGKNCAPIMSFQASLGKEYEFFSIPLKKTYVSIETMGVETTPAGEEPDDPENEEEEEDAYFLDSQASLGGEVGQQLPLAITTGIPFNGKTYYLAGEFVDKKISFLNMTEFLLGNNLVQMIPEGLRGFGSELKLAQFGLGFSIQPIGIDYLSLDITYDKDVEVIPGTQFLKFKNLGAGFCVTRPLTNPSFSCVLSGTISLFSDSFALSFSAGLPEFVISGGLAEDSKPIDISTIFSNYGLPTGILPTTFPKITDLTFMAAPFSKAYSLALDVQPQDWKLSISGFEIKLSGLGFSINYNMSVITGEIHTQIILGEIPIDISASHPSENIDWIFSVKLSDRTDLSVNKLIQQFFKVDLPPSFGNLVIKKLAVVITTSKSSPTTFSLATSISWDNISVLGIQLSLAADFFITNANKKLLLTNPTSRRDYAIACNAEQKWYGEFLGKLEIFNVPIEIYFDFVKGETTTFQYKFRFWGIECENKTDYLRITFPNLTVGEIIQRFVNFVEPDLNFKLEAPWDFLNSINLDGLEILINKNKSVTIVYEKINLNLGFMCLKGFTFTYKFGEVGKSKVELGIIGSFMDKTYSKDQPMAWDVLNDPPPAVPGQDTGVFNLEYLGIGQHLAFKNPAPFQSITDVITALEKCMVPPAGVDKNPLEFNDLMVFNELNEWTIGTKFTVVSTISVSAIFNDPNIYGLLISLAGAKAKSFAGLSFEILYQKINDTIGKYHIELKLPDMMRHFEVGAFSLTLPIVVVDIYTNGNFMVDLGFPKNRNFARSFSIQAFPFIGMGGFYIAVLEGATSTKVPQTTKGYFKPVIEFGLGLSIGLGKSFNAGILSASLSLSVQAILEGVYALYNPNDKKLPSADYFYLQGEACIIGLVSGSINFVIIQASVTLRAYALIRLTVESYQPTYIYLEIGVDAEVRLFIFFFTINFSFHLNLSFSFQIGAKQLAPWNANQILLANSLIYTLTNPNAKLNWDPDQILPTEKMRNFELTLAMAFSQGYLKDTTQPQPQANALFFIQNSIPTTAQNYNDYKSIRTQTDSSFDLLGQVILGWAIQSYLQLPNPSVDLYKPETTIKYIDLNYIYGKLEEGRSAYRFIYETLLKLLVKNFRIITVVPRPVQASNEDVPDKISGALFPIFKDLSLVLNDGTVIDFSQKSKCQDDYLTYIQKYFSELAFKNVTSVDQELADHQANRLKKIENTEYDQSLATYIFEDYFFMLLKGILQSAIDQMKTNEHIWQADDTLENLKSTYKLRCFSDLANANQFNTDLLNVGQAIKISKVQYQILNNSNLTSIASQFNINAVDIVKQNALRPDILQEGAQIQYSGGTYLVKKEDTFTSIATHIGKTLDELTGFIAQQTDLLKPLAHLELPSITHTIQDQETLYCLAQTYAIEAVDILNDDDNQKNKNIFIVGKTLVISNISEISVNQLMLDLKSGPAFKQLSAYLSRFFMYGLRLADPGQPDYKDPAKYPDLKLYSLFDLIGQQFNIPDASTGYLIKIKNTQGLSWFGFNEVPLTLTQDEVQATTYYKNATLSIPAILKPTTLFEDVPRRFSLENCIIWSMPQELRLQPHFDQEKDKPLNGVPSIWLFSKNLETLLLKSTELLPFYFRSGTPVQNQTSLESPSLALFSCGIKIDIGVQLIQNQNVQHLYEISGTDAQGADLLFNFLKNAAHYFPDQTYSLKILYNPNPCGVGNSGFESDDFNTEDILLVKTNLSTLTHSPSNQHEFYNTDIDDVYGAKLSETKDFLELIWECSTVNSGGFYLHYQTKTGAGFPDSIFDQSPKAKISLLVLPVVSPETKTGPTQTLIANFHNCLVTTDLINTAQSVLFAESADEKERRATLPAGNIGFDITRPVPDPRPSLSNGASWDNLDTLYHLLSYKIKPDDGTSGFNASPEGVPVGPKTIQDPDGSQKWYYHNILSVYEFAKNRATYPGNTLPDPKANPYAGLGESATLTFSFHDVFGNSTHWNAGEHPINPEITYPILYFDEIQDFSKWPNVGTGYEFMPTNKLNITLDFRNEKYITDETKTKKQMDEMLKSDLKQYQRIYYQIKQPDLNFYLTTNLETQGKKHLLDKAQIINYVGNIYEFLLAQLSNQQCKAILVQEKSVDYLIHEAYHISASAFAKANQDLIGIFKDQSTIQLPVYALIHYKDSLNSIVSDLAEKHITVTPVDLINQNPENKDILNPGFRFCYRETTQAYQPTDTFINIALAQSVSITVQELIQQGGNQNLALNPGIVLQIQGTSYTVQEGDTFATLAHKTNVSIEVLAIDNETQTSIFKPDPQPNLAIPIIYEIEDKDSFSSLLQKTQMSAQQLADLLKDLIGLLSTGGVILVSHKSHTYSQTETLSSLAFAESQAQNLYISTADILNANLLTNLQPNIEFIMPGLQFLNPGTVSTYTVHNPNAETLASIIQTLQKNISVEELANVNQNMYRILKKDTVLTIPDSNETFIIRDNDTLGTIVKSLIQAHPSLTVKTLAKANENIAMFCQDAVLICPAPDIFFSTTIEPGYAGNADLFPVNVDLIINRDINLVNPDFRSSSAYQTINDLVPRFSLNSTNQNPSDHSLSLTEFATHFESTFSDLKVAVGSSKSDEENPSKPKKIWAIYLSAESGLFCNIKPDVIYYAPAPLSNHLLSYDQVSISPWQGGTAIHLSFEDIDLDLWANDFLCALDLFFSPQYALTAYQLNSTFYNEIAAAKKQLSEAISRSVIKVLNDSQPTADSLKVARETFKQQLLQKLSSAYTIETIVQFMAETFSSSQVADTAPRFSGQPLADEQLKENDAAELGFTLSSAKIPLYKTAQSQKAQSYLTFLFDVKSPADNKHILLTSVKFQINQVEYHIENDPDLSGYQASDWLSFVLPMTLPITTEVVKNIDVPIPLRAYPDIPSLDQQRYIQIDEPSTFEQIKQWHYFYTYQQSIADQDYLRSKIDFNVGLVSQNLTGDEEIKFNFFQALAQFVQTYSELWKELQNLFTPSPINRWERGAGGEGSSSDPYQAFHDQVQNVAQWWDKYTSIVPKKANTQEENFAFCIKEFENAENRWNIRVDNPQGVLPTLVGNLPYVLINQDDSALDVESEDPQGKWIIYKYRKPDGSYYTKADIQAVRTRTVHIKGFDNLKTQNTWPGVSVTRNESLQKDTTKLTNAPFIYHTPEAKFINKTIPLITHDEALNMAQFIPQQKDKNTTKPLINYLADFFGNLLNFNELVHPVCLELACNYTYTIIGDLKTSLPILLQTRFDISADDVHKENPNGLVYKLNQAMTNWQTQNKPSQSGGRYIFKVSLYSNELSNTNPTETSNQLILELNNLYLNLGD